VSSPPPAETEAYSITGYPGIESGDIMPYWFRQYREGGCRIVETLPEFSGGYFFLGINEGDDIETLRLWAQEFSAARDLPRLVASRVEERMTGEFLYPDDEYGEFFERFVKAVSDSVFEGASIHSVFWIRRRIDGEAGPERYVFFVPVVIAKPLLREQLSGIMEKITTAVRPTREQAAAINRLKADFFDGF
jgi:hypothetical protein